MDNAFSIGKYRAIFSEEHGNSTRGVLYLSNPVTVCRGLYIDNHADNCAFFLAIAGIPGKCLDWHTPAPDSYHISKTIIPIAEIVKIIPGPVYTAGCSRAAADYFNKWV